MSDRWNKLKPPGAKLRVSIRRGFSIVEMLVVVAIIVVLLSILIFAMSRATRMGQRTQTEFLMSNINQALTRFKEDTGYYPPVLGNPAWMSGSAPTGMRDLHLPYDPNDPTVNAGGVSKWYSITSLAEYLVGYGPHDEDGWGFDPAATPLLDWDAEKPAIGIRHPGDDGVWGATRFATAPDAGLLTDRMLDVTGMRGSETVPTNWDRGKVLGPYLELGNDDLLAAISSSGELVFPGEAGYSSSTIKVLVDYWGQPLRYYRLPYPPGRIGQTYRKIDRDGDGVHDPVGLAEVTLLRPYDMKPGMEMQVHDDFADSDGDQYSTKSLRTGEFAIFSSGPDKQLDGDSRIDPAERNKDNIVEVGP